MVSSRNRPRRAQRRAENRVSSIMHARTERNRAVQAYRPVARSARAPYKITRSSWLRPALAGVSSSLKRLLDAHLHTTRPGNSMRASRSKGWEAACTEKLNRRDHRQGVGETLFGGAFAREPSSPFCSSEGARESSDFQRRRNRARQEEEAHERSARGRKDEEPKRSRRERGDPLRGSALKMKTFRWRYDSV